MRILALFLICISGYAETLTERTISVVSNRNVSALYQLAFYSQKPSGNIGELSATNWIRRTSCVFTTSKGVTAMSSGRVGAMWYQSPCTLISPQHALTAQHNAAPIGEVFFWTTTNNQYHARSVLDKTNVTSDVCILLLNSPITEVEYMRVPPSNWITNYAPNVYNLTKETQLQVYGVAAFSYTYIHGLYPTTYYNIRMGSSSWYSDITRSRAIVGDSGNPLFIWDGEELYLLGAWYSAVTAGPFLDNLDLVDQAMEGISVKHGFTPYTVTHATWDYENFGTPSKVQNFKLTSDPTPVN